ncbi:hypothetical protein HA402_015721 [Bradysia odoriphaga]|nr:hypothetical protein HA402_015721 [Bradysia odoriphaga]
MNYVTLSVCRFLIMKYAGLKGVIRVKLVQYSGSMLYQEDRGSYTNILLALSSFQFWLEFINIKWPMKPPHMGMRLESLISWNGLTHSPSTHENRNKHKKFKKKQIVFL